MKNGWCRIVWVMMLVMAASVGTASEEVADETKPEARVIAVVLGEEIRDDRPSERAHFINQAVWTRLKAKYVRENKLEPTEEEIGDFLEWRRKFSEQTQAENEEEIGSLKAELAGDKLSVLERAQKEGTLEMLESFLERRKWSSNLTLEQNERLKVSERILARVMVTHWKFNKSLFEKYGGRIMFQQAGVEPFDAYRQFLKDQEKAGAFEIRDEEARRHFWSQYSGQPPGPENLIMEGEKAKEEINLRLWVEGVKEKEEGEKE